MDYLAAGRKIIDDITFFSILCERHALDEEAIQADLHEHSLHLHRDGYNKASIEDNCANAKVWLDFYRAQYGDREEGYILLGRFAEHRTVACLDSIIDTLDAFISDGDNKGLNDNSDYKEISQFISRTLAANVKKFCSEKERFTKIEHIIQYILSVDIVSKYISEGKTKKGQKDRKDKIEEAINEHINEILEREFTGNPANSAEVICPKVAMIDDGLMPPLDITVVQALFFLNRTVPQKLIPQYLKRWRALRDAQQVKGGRRTRRARRRQSRRRGRSQKRRHV
jgi:predicted transcriptional regulator